MAKADNKRVPQWSRLLDGEVEDHAIKVKLLFRL